MTSPKLGCCKVILLLVGMSACFFLPAHAQTENGAIRGSVTDPSGALVPGASVRLIDDDRGLQTEVATGNGGGYTFSTVRPGHYRMEVEKSGFKLARLTGITLNVLENQEQNFRLDVGPVSDSITVKANALNVNTSDGTVSAVVDRTFADNLPLNGRSFQTLIMLTPGVVVAPTAFDDQGQFSVNGQRADANYFAVDGVSANFGVTGYTALVQAAGGALPALSVSGGTNSLVSVDAMQEFRVQTSSYAPEFGRTPGGQISIATRSGTNAFHGTLFEYFRNDALDASDWFVGFNQLRRPEERQNDFGGVFGGPILKDKTFFFFSYEGLRLRQPSTQETLVPDNASRQQAPTGIQPFMNAYPVQNGPEAGSGLAQFNASYSNPSSLDAYSIRVDQVVNSKMNLFGRYNYSPSTFTLRGPLVTTPVLSTSESELSSIQTLTLGFNHLLTARITNEIRANYSNDRVGTKFILDNSGGAVPLPDSLVFPSGYSSANAIFSLTITGAGTYQKGKQATDEQRQVNLIDNLSLIIGGHQLKFGVDYRWLSPFSSPSGYRQQANFLGVTCSTPPCSGYAISGTSEFAVTYAFQSDALLTPNYSVYGQDTWRILPRLTMTYGLRWDINPALKGKTMADQPFTVTGLNDPATIALAPRGTPLYQTTYGNVAPRIGAAYQPRRGTNWDSVLRGGFGIFYDLGHGSLGGASGYFPFFALKIIPSASFPLSPGDATPPVLTTNPPVNTMIVADRHLKLPRTYEWNGAFEQSVGKSQTLSLTYVGAVGRDLLRETNIVVDPAVNPNFSFMDFTDNSAKSDYHALQAKFEKRLSQGLQALMSYTWSHSIDIASTDAFATYLNTPSFIGNPNIDRGNSNFDIRHAFTAGVTYNVPTPGWNDFARAVLGGWSVDSFVFAQSAPPVDVIGGYSFADGTAIRYRPNVNHGIPLVIYNSQDPGGKHFNKNAFSSPPPGQQGDLGRNVLRGFGAVHADFAIQRQFQFTERVALRLRGEFFNIFNHPNFGPPINDLTSALFGRSTQTLASSLGSGGPNGGFNPLYQIGGPRSIQLALKLRF
jgi:Carboxypeptidase regulatory-like domain/TonB dependent receptor-like, beta-barrel